MHCVRRRGGGVSPSLFLLSEEGGMKIPSHLRSPFFHPSYENPARRPYPSQSHLSYFFFRIKIFYSLSKSSQLTAFPSQVESHHNQFFFSFFFLSLLIHSPSPPLAPKPNPRAKPPTKVRTYSVYAKNPFPSINPNPAELRSAEFTLSSFIHFLTSVLPLAGLDERAKAELPHSPAHRDSTWGPYLTVKGLV